MSCKCQECGKKYKLDLIIDDKIWEHIKPAGKEKEAGLLCGSCIINKIEKIEGYSVFNLN